MAKERQPAPAVPDEQSPKHAATRLLLPTTTLTEPKTIGLRSPEVALGAAIRKIIEQKQVNSKRLEWHGSLSVDTPEGVVNVPVQYSANAIGKAVAHSRSDLVTTLLENGADCDVQIRILSNDANNPFSLTFTPLGLSVYNENVPLALQLITADADVHTQENTFFPMQKTHCSMLCYVVFRHEQFGKDCARLLQALLERGADPNQRIYTVANKKTLAFWMLLAAPCLFLPFCLSSLRRYAFFRGETAAELAERLELPNITRLLRQENPPPSRQSHLFQPQGASTTRRTVSSSQSADNEESISMSRDVSVSVSTDAGSTGRASPALPPTVEVRFKS